jgi:predicted AAA+ superfamily ATPase
VDTLVIDQAQFEPGLFRAIKAEVDRDRRPGRFRLTGPSVICGWSNCTAPGFAACG